MSATEQRFYQVSSPFSPIPLSTFQTVANKIGAATPWLSEKYQTFCVFSRSQLFFFFSTGPFGAILRCVPLQQRWRLSSRCCSTGRHWPGFLCLCADFRCGGTLLGPFVSVSHTSQESLKISEQRRWRARHAGFTAGCSLTSLTGILLFYDQLCLFIIRLNGMKRLRGN